VITPRGFIDDPRWGIPDPSDQGLVASFGIIETPALIAWEAMHVEVVFRDINPDVSLCHLLPCLCLSSGAKPLVSVQA